MTDELKKAIALLRASRVDLETVLREVDDDSGPPTSVRIDVDRIARCGHPEAVWGPKKSDEQIERAVAQLEAAGSPVLVTRVRDRMDRLAARMPQLVVNRDAGCLHSAIPEADASVSVAVLTAGTSDIPVAEEAALTCALSGLAVDRLFDVGVSGLHRLTARIGQVRSADVVIVAAGMEGALPSVVGGLVSAPVIAIPTSVGYGASFGGISALLGMLNSCAAGVTVVNIDNGFGAAVAAIRILHSRKS